MGWRDQRFGFMKIEDNKKYRVRVLMPFKCKKCGVSGYYPNWPNESCSCGAPANALVEAECVSGWYHRVPSVIDPQSRATIRKYRTFLCNLQTEARGGRKECQAGLCGKLDPMFKMLSIKDQKKKRAGIEVDCHLGVMPQHIITVYSYDESRAMVLKFGNDLRSEFVRIITAKNALAGRDIIVWREKNNNQTTYKAEAQDPSTFTEDVDYSSISFEQILKFENVDPVKVWEFVSTGKISGEGETQELPEAEPQMALGPAHGISVGDLEKYKAIRSLVVDVGKRFAGRTFGHLIDSNEFDYFKWLMNTSGSQEIREAAAWISDMHNSGNLRALMDSGTAEPMPEPQPVLIKYAEPQEPTGSKAVSSKVDTINKICEEKFANKPDNEIIAFLANVYGPYKSVVELSIESWPDDKLDALEKALAAV